MAVTVSAVAVQSGHFARKSSAIFDVIASADADTTITIPHGLGVIPDRVNWEYTDAAARLSLPIETLASRDATNVVLVKTTTGSSGAAGVQLRVYIDKPWSGAR